MSYRLPFFIFLFIAFTSVSFASDFDSLIAQMTQGEKEQIYPEPQDKALKKVREPFDKVIWVFRALCESKQRAESGSGIDDALRDALHARHREESWLFTKSLVRAMQDGKNKKLEKFQQCLENLSLPEDAAAFVPVFDRLPEDLAQVYAPFQQQVTAMAAKLANNSSLATYVAHTEFDKDFFKKKRPWHYVADVVQNGFEGLMSRLEERFCKENLIRFFVRVQGWKVPQGVKNAASKTQTKLMKSLQEVIEIDFDDRVEGGLCRKTQGIETVNGYIMMKTTLLNGRMRRFVKRIQKYEGNDLKLFLPLVGDLKRHVSHVAFHGQDLDGETKDYLKEVKQTFENMQVILKLKARKEITEDKDEALWQTIRLAVGELDEEGLFSGL